MKKIISLLFLYSFVAFAQAENLNYGDVSRCASGSIANIYFEPNEQDHTLETMTIVINGFDFYTNNAALQRLLYSVFSEGKDLEIYASPCFSDPQINFIKVFR